MLGVTHPGGAPGMCGGGIPGVKLGGGAVTPPGGTTIMSGKPLRLYSRLSAVITCTFIRNGNVTLIAILTLYTFMT